MRNVGSSFVAMAVVPITSIVSFAIGVYVVTNNIPMAFVYQSAAILLGFWMAVFLIVCIVAAVQDVMAGAIESAGQPISLLPFTPLESRQEEDTMRQMVLYIVNDGEVVDRLKTRRGYYQGMREPLLDPLIGKLLQRFGWRRRQATPAAAMEDQKNAG